MTLRALGIAAALMAAAGGCADTTRVADPAPAAGAARLDDRDFEFAARRAVAAFFRNPLSRRPGGAAPWAAAVGGVVNDTALDIDTGRLAEAIGAALRDSGRAIVAADAAPADSVELSLSARIGKRHTDYYFQLAVTDADTGQARWAIEELVAPRRAAGGDPMRAMARLLHAPVLAAPPDLSR